MDSKNVAVNEVSSAEKFVDRLLTEGIQIGCKESNFSDKNEPPPFYDEELYKKGQEFFYKHIFSMFFSKFNGLLAVLAVPPVLKILIFTEKSSTNFSAYVRYMSTIFHMLVWYRDDFKPGSKLWKSLSQVNNKHIMASKKCCSVGLGKISQKDMALTQFGFMGFQLSRSEQVGIYYATEEEWRAFIHVWKVVGYLMGIENRFNICSGSVEHTKEVCNILIDKCFYPEIAKKDPDYLKMSSHLIGGMWSMNPFLIYKVIMNYLYVLLQNPDKNNNNNNRSTKPPYFNLNTISLLVYYFLNINFYLARFDIFRQIFNYLHHLNLWFMREWPILAYYSFGSTPNTIVKLKL